jgi:hypothetical protein
VPASTAKKENQKKNSTHFPSMSVQAPAYSHGRTGTVGINEVRRVGRGYIVKFPHPMHFLLSSGERHFPSMAVCYATAVGSEKVKSTWGVEIPQDNPHPMHFLLSSGERA